MAALLSSGNAEYAHYWCSSIAELFLCFEDDLAKKVSKPLLVVLDNVTIHLAGAIQHALEQVSSSSSCRPTARNPTASRSCGA